MKFFIDTANVEDIKKANDMGVICGVTTNPSLIAKEGRVFEEVIAEIASIVDGPISGEVKATTTDAEGMIAEGREIAKIHLLLLHCLPVFQHFSFHIQAMLPLYTKLPPCTVSIFSSYCLLSFHFYQ